MGTAVAQRTVSYAALLGIQLITHICARKPKHLQSQLPKIHALDFQKEDLKNTISNKLSIEDHKLENRLTPFSNFCAMARLPFRVS